MATKTWTATNTHTYRGSKWRSQREMYQGDYTGSGNNIGFAWFNTSDIASTLSGQIIDKVEVYLHRVNSSHGHSWALPINLYTHKVTDGGSVNTSAFTNKQTNIASFLRNEGKWFTVTNAVGEALRNGSANGIVLYHSADQDHYMIFDAYNSSYPPQLRITYHVANTAPTTPGSFTSPSSGGIYESSVSVAWGASTDVDGDTLTYYLEASINGGSYSQIYSGTARSYTHNITGVTRGHSIKYRVRAHDGTVYSGYRESSTCYRNRVPNTPSAFSAPTSNTRYESSIPVSWGASTDPDGHSVTYRLEVSINGGTYSQIYSGSSTSYTHSITGVTRGQSIQYRVRAYDGMAYSSYRTSSLCYRNNAPSTPGTFTSPSGTITNRGLVTITWGHSTDDQTAQASLKYELGLSVNGGTSYTILKSFDTGNSYTYNFVNWTTNLNYNASSCYFRVRAQDQHGVTSGYRTSSVFAIDFRKPPEPPGVFTGVGTSVENQTITIGWGVSTDPNEDAVTYLLQFWNRSVWVTIASDLTTNSYSYTLPAVSAEHNDYKFRVRAKDATGLTSSYRESGTFTITQNSAPSLVANTYSQRTMSTVKVSGSITNLGGHSLTQYGIKWGTSSSSLTNTVNLGTRSTTGSFIGDITGLDGNTVYYARTYATNAKGTTLSSELITIPKYNPPLYIDTLGVGVGKKREQGTLDVAGDIYANNIHVTPTSIFVEGDANTYYPVQIHPVEPFAYHRYSISRWYSATAPDTWNTAAHRGGLTFDFEWSGDTAWGGNHKAIRVVEFAETYTTMVAGMVLTVSGLIVWLRGGGAVYNVTSTAKARVPATIHLGDFISADNNVWSPRTNTNNVESEIKAKWAVRNSSLLYDSGTRVSVNGHGHSWGEISGKPSTFTPSAHNQAWSTITGTPSTYPPSAHTHNYLPISNPSVNGILYMNSWIYSAGNYGWYSSTYGGGWYMTDTSWVRSYGNKGIYTGGVINCGSGFQINGSSIDNRYLMRSDIRVGSFRATSTTGTNVSFSSAMSSAPWIYVSYGKTGANVSGDWGAPKVYNLTASGFSCIIGGSNDTTERNIYYFAILP